MRGSTYGSSVNQQYHSGVVHGPPTLQATEICEEALDVGRCTLVHTSYSLSNGVHSQGSEMFFVPPLLWMNWDKGSGEIHTESKAMNRRTLNQREKESK